MLINFLGEPLVRRDYRRHGLPEWYAMDDRGDVTYTCFDSTPLRVVWRTTVSATVTLRAVAYGAGEDRETLEDVPLAQAVGAAR